MGCDSLCLSLQLCPSHCGRLSHSCFCSLSHTCSHAVQMNAHTNVTDCETVTHIQQRFFKKKRKKKSALSPLFFPSKVWHSPVFVWLHQWEWGTDWRRRVFNLCEQWLVLVQSFNRLISQLSHENAKHFSFQTRILLLFFSIHLDIAVF